MPSIPPIKRFCVDCGIKHLIQDCPSNLEFKGKTSLNLVELIPSPCQSSSKSDPIVPINVITRAQVREQEQSGEESWKPKKSVRVKRNLRYRKNRQKRIAEAKNSAKETTQEIGSNQSLRPNQQEQENPQRMGIARDEPHLEINRPQAVESGGSVLADKHMETLEGLMKAYEARLKARETIE